MNDVEHRMRNRIMNIVIPPQVVTSLTRAAVIASLAHCVVDTPAFAQKTDVVTLNNGDAITGEVKELKSGKLKYKTDAISTIYIEWPKISTLVTEGKIFEVELVDGATYFGSLRVGEEANQIRLLVDADTITVATDDVVRLARIKKSVWDQIDGNLDLGFDYTQENDKLDFSLSSDVDYRWGLNNLKWDLGITLSRQEGASDISKLNTSLIYIHQFGHRWFWTGLTSVESNTQLSLDIRGSFGGGLGRYMIQTNKVILGLAGGVAYARERFTDQEADNLGQAFVMTDFQFFSWGGLDTDLSSRFVVIPVFTESGRVRLVFKTKFQRELVNNFYFSIGLTESYDSKPPDPTAATNDLTFSTSLGWSF
jgi:putative salt-induced outer membrane protein YdiY